MEQKFNEWFDKNFPPENFGYLSGAFREAMRTDIALKAFQFGLTNGYASNFDHVLHSEIADYLRGK